MRRCGGALPWLGAAVLALCATAATDARCGEPAYEISSVDLARLGPRMQRQIASLQYLMNAHQRRQFFRLENDEARREWIARFWRAHDPTPTTPENEMKTEHYLRADIARADFGRSEFPGWDRRGEVLIRYGFPDNRCEIKTEETPRKFRPPGELWYYRRHRMIVQFADVNLNGDHSFAVTPLGDAQDISADLAEFLIYDTKDSIQEKIPPQYLEFYREAEVIDTGVEWDDLRTRIAGLEPQRYLRPRMARETESISEVNATDWTRSIPDNPADVFLREDAQEMATNFQAVLEDTPSSYPFNFEQKSLPYYFDVEQFRGGEGVNRVEVNLEILVSPGDSPKPVARNFVAEVAVMDEDYSLVERKASRVAVPVSAATPPRLFPAQIVFSLPRGYYRLAVNVEDADDGRRSAYRTNVSARNFDRNLALSDVLFAQRIAPVTDVSPFARGPIEVVPHPIRRYAVGSPVSVYFEIYNLGLDENDRSNYKVEYRVVPHSEKKRSFFDRFDDEQTVFASRFEGSGHNANEPLHLAIRSENLKPGLYDFLVTVKDEYWQSTAHRQATFRIVEPSEKVE